MNGKNISLTQTTIALKELGSALSDCTEILNEKKINADNKNIEYENKLNEAQRKIEILTQGSQNTIDNINNLVAKLDEVLN